MKRLFLAAAAAMLIWSAAIRAEDIAQGRALFERRCGGCHALDRDKEGPRLGGVFGRAAGVVASFDYSEALRKSGLKWNAKTLDRWLAGPETVVPATDMNFRVPDPAERQAIIAFLRSKGK